jgi:hypothetical protein
MPGTEVRAVVDSKDPDLVRRYLELHTERLEERLAAQRRRLARLESALVRSIGPR